MYSSPQRPLQLATNNVIKKKYTLNKCTINAESSSSLTTNIIFQYRPAKLELDCESWTAFRLINTTLHLHCAAVRVRKQATKVAAQAAVEVIFKFF